MHKTLSLGYTRSETEDCKEKIFFAAKNGGYTPEGYCNAWCTAPWGYTIFSAGDGGYAPGGYTPKLL